MIDEPTDPELKTAVSPGAAESDEERFWDAVDEILASEREFQKRTGHLQLNRWITAEMMLAFALGNFSTAFIQALGTRAADGAAKLPKRMSDLVRTRVHRKGKPDEYQFGVDDGSAATIAITANTPDEARLALLDLDVTADELRGKLLRWDELRMYRLDQDSEQQLKDFFASYEPPGWFQAQARLLAYASDDVWAAFETTRRAGLEVWGLYRQYKMLGQGNLLPAESGRPGAAADGGTMIKARRAVNPAIQEAEAKDEAVIKLIRDELRSKPESADMALEPSTRRRRRRDG